MRITLIGSRHFGVTTLDMLRQRGVDVVRVVVADGDDRLATAARAAGIEVTVQADPKCVVASEIAPDTDLIVTAHSHARINQEALAAAKLGGIGYHPSLLPRHRGIAAVEWTIREGDPIAGGSIYHLAERMDAGAIAAQEWVFVRKGETARELWERALAPLGQKLLGEVIDYAKTHKSLPAKPQDEEFATRAIPRNRGFSAPIPARLTPDGFGPRQEHSHPYVWLEPREHCLQCNNSECSSFRQSESGTDSCAHDRIRTRFRFPSCCCSHHVLHPSPRRPMAACWNVRVVTKSGSCEPRAGSSLIVTDGKVTAQASNVSAGLGHDGLVRVSIHGAYASGQLSGNAGSGNWNGASAGIPCSGRWQTSRQRRTSDVRSFRSH